MSSQLQRLKEMRKNAAEVRRGGRHRAARSALSIVPSITKENMSAYREQCKIITPASVKRVENARRATRGKAETRIQISLYINRIVADIVAKGVEFMAARDVSTLGARDIAEAYRVVTGRVVYGKGAPMLPGSAPRRATRAAAAAADTAAAVKDDDDAVMLV